MNKRTNKPATPRKKTAAVQAEPTVAATPAVEESAKEARARRRQNRQREMLDRPSVYANRLQQVSGRLSFSSDARAKQARLLIEQAREKLTDAAGIIKTLPASAVPAKRTDIALATGVTVVLTKKGKDWAGRLLGASASDALEGTWAVLNASAQHVRIRSTIRPIDLSPASRLVSILGVAESDEDSGEEAVPNGVTHLSREEAQEDTGL